MSIKAITVYQPWADLLAIGAKQFETRGWETSYRGQIAIHAGSKGFASVMKMVFPMGEWEYHPDFDAKKRFIKEANHFMRVGSSPLGSIVAIADLVGCWRMYRTGSVLFCMRNNEPYYPSEREKMFGGWADGRFAWELQNVRQLDKPIRVAGHQGLWNWEEDLHA